MNTIIIHPKTKAKENAIKAVLEALDISFEQKEEEIFPQHVVSGLKKGIQQAKTGETKSYTEVKKLIANRWS